MNRDFLALVTAGFLFASGFSSLLPVINPIGIVVGLAILYIAIDRRMMNKGSPLGIFTAILLVHIPVFFLNLLWTLRILRQILSWNGLWSGLFIYGFFVTWILVQLWSWMILPAVALLGPKRWRQVAASVWQEPILFAAFITVWEMYFPSVLPLSLGSGLIHAAPYLFPATIFSQYVYTFTTVWLARVLSRYDTIPTWHWRTIGVYLVCFVAISLAFPLEQPSGAKKIAAQLVTPNLDRPVNTRRLSEKEMREEAAQFAAQVTSLAKMHYQPGTVELQIFPEIVLLGPIAEEDARIGEEFAEPYIRDLALSNDHDILVGFNTGSYVNDDKITRGNAVTLLDARAVIKERFDKVQLVPYFEGFGSSWIDRLLFAMIGGFDEAEGERFPVFVTSENKHRFVVAICYEALFSRVMQNYLRQVDSPQFIVNVSNDFLIKRTKAVEHEKVFLSWRAIETQLPIIRVADHGPSGVFGIDGAFLEVPTGLQPAVNTVQVPLSDSQSFFARWGYLLLFLLLAGMVVFSMSMKRFTG